MARTPFVALPPAMLDEQGLTPTHIVIYLATRDRQEHRKGSPDYGKAFPGAKAVADRLGVSERTVREAWGLLEEKGYLTFERNQGPKAARISFPDVNARSGQAMNPRAGLAMQSDAASPAAGPRLAMQSGASIKDPDHYYPERDPHTNGDPDGVCASFDDFMRNYPRPINEAEAFEAWRSLNPDPQLVKTILAAVRSQTSSRKWKNEDGRFIPAPAKYLLERQWEQAKAPQKTGYEFPSCRECLIETRFSDLDCELLICYACLAWLKEQNGIGKNVRLEPAQLAGAAP